MSDSSFALGPSTYMQNKNKYTIYQHLCTYDDIYTSRVYDMPCDNV